MVSRRNPKDIVIVDYCEFHMHYHPFLTSSDADLSREVHPVLDLTNKLPDLYDYCHEIMNHKRELLLEAKVWIINTP